MHIEAPIIVQEATGADEQATGAVEQLTTTDDDEQATGGSPNEQVTDGENDNVALEVPVEIEAAINRIVADPEAAKGRATAVGGCTLEQLKAIAMALGLPKTFPKEKLVDMIVAKKVEWNN